MKLDISSVREFDGADIIHEVYGKITDFSEQDANSVVEFIAQRANLLQSRIITKLNQQVADGIKNLAFYDVWPNLSQVARHALEEELMCLKRDKHASQIQDIIELVRLRLEFFNIGISQLPEFIEQLQNNPIIQASLAKHRKG